MTLNPALFYVRFLLAAAVVSLSLGGIAQAAGSDAPAEQSTTPAKKSKTKKVKKAAGAGASKAKFLRGSEETKAERRARLKIECRGAVNAGVCTGYTR